MRHSFFASAIFFLGLAFGSFLSVCIYRLPLGLSVVKPRSACPGCARPIAFYDNIPGFSWLILRGRCRQCKTKISPRYLLVELLTGVLFLACYWYFGLTFATLKYCTFAFLLLGLIFTDAETKLLPDKMTLPGLVLGLLFSLVVPVNDLASQLVPMAVNLPFSGELVARLLSLLDSLLGAAVGASFIYGAGAILSPRTHRRRPTLTSESRAWPCWLASSQVVTNSEAESVRFRRRRASTTVSVSGPSISATSPPTIALSAAGLPSATTTPCARRTTRSHGSASVR